MRAAASLAFLIACLTIAFYATAFVYQRTGRPSALVVRIVNTLLGVFIMVLFAAIAGVLFRLRNGGPFAPTSTRWGESPKETSAPGWITVMR